MHFVLFSSCNFIFSSFICISICNRKRIYNCCAVRVIGSTVMIAQSSIHIFQENWYLICKCIGCRHILIVTYIGCTHIYAYILDAYIFECTYIEVKTHTYTHLVQTHTIYYTYTLGWKHTHTHIHKHTHTYTNNTHIHKHTHTYTYTHIHIHTYTLSAHLQLGEKMIWFINYSKAFCCWKVFYVTGKKIYRLCTFYANLSSMQKFLQYLHSKFMSMFVIQTLMHS